MEVCYNLVHVSSSFDLIIVVVALLLLLFFLRIILCSGVQYFGGEINLIVITFSIIKYKQTFGVLEMSLKFNRSVHYVLDEIHM